MSDYYIKIIPTDPYCRVPETVAETVRAYLEDCMVAMSAEVVVHEAPAFVDCGGYLQKISCPFCGSDLFAEGWWTDAMNAAADSKELFAELEEQELPCCGRRASLNDLQYDYPCGFACTEFALLYPRERPRQEHIKELERMLGMQVRVIYARY